MRLGSGLGIFTTLSDPLHNHRLGPSNRGIRRPDRASRQIWSALLRFPCELFRVAATSLDRTNIKSMAETTGLFQKSELHALLQVLMARGCLPVKEAEETFVAICDRSSGTNIQEAVSEINRSIDFAHLRVKFTRFHLPGSEEVVTYVGIANTAADAASSMVTRYSALQVAYFRAIVEAIAEDPDHTIGSKDAINLGLSVACLDVGNSHVDGVSTQPATSQVQGHPADAKKMTMSEKQAAIERMVEDGWLMKTSDGHVALGPRSGMEIQPFLDSLGVNTEADPGGPT